MFAKTLNDRCESAGAFCLPLIILLAAGTSARASNPVVIQDDPADAVHRPTDPLMSAPFSGTAENLVELLSMSIGRWQPSMPTGDLFEGNHATDGTFVRIDLSLLGLVNPPGPIQPANYAPYNYGPLPIYGFIEVDMDGDVWTGGEVDAPEYRYLANIARFGGRPAEPAFLDRVLVDSSTMDESLSTPPYFERHGEEFHLALLGSVFTPADITVLAGNTNTIFEPGETWLLTGSFFHRAHAFEPFSFVQGGAHAGEYAPECRLRFHHDLAEDRTLISLVVPLTQEGAGQMRGEPPEPLNQDPTDHSSVLEALFDLHLSALFLEGSPGGPPAEQLILEWAEKDPWMHLDPAGWRVTALIGTAYPSPPPSGTLYLWTDAYPNVVLGDIDGSGSRTGQDSQPIASYIAANDALDGVTDGRVVLPGFASAFMLFDLNYDGEVSQHDLAYGMSQPDADSDGDVDLEDFSQLQRCFGELWPLTNGCVTLDLTGSQRIGLDDYLEFEAAMTGPQPD